MGFFYMIHLIRRGFEVYALQGKSHTRHHIKNTHLMMSVFFVYDTLDPKGIQSLYPLGETPHALMIKGAVAK